jgi:hypothetical protein
MNGTMSRIASAAFETNIDVCMDSQSETESAELTIPSRGGDDDDGTLNVCCWAVGMPLALETPTAIPRRRAAFMMG